MGIKVTPKKLKDKKDKKDEKKFIADISSTYEQDAAMKSPRKQKSTTRKYKGGFMGKGSGRATRGY